LFIVESFNFAGQTQKFGSTQIQNITLLLLLAAAAAAAEGVKCRYGMGWPR
jgi:hypothetical protein